VDEVSMVDQQLLHRLLVCTRPDARIVFVGDHAQLPSVGPGNVLRDIIASEVFPTVTLTQIFRQKDTSGIVYAAHAIHAGEVPELNSDFRLLSLSSEEEVLDAVLKIGVKLFEARKNFQILSPKHQGTVGVTNLNARLRELINPASPGRTEVRLGEDTIREGDRIMVTQNDYTLGVFNGDIGKVSKVDRSKKEIEVKIYGDVPLYLPMSFGVASKLIRLAYCTTVHKSQGLEHDMVVLPLVTGFYHQLQRNLLYTAITRAKKQVILVGQHEALVKAVFNAKEDERATLFLDRLVASKV
jgi:exodeoxyribonuclease V alpha subunit